MTPRRLFHLAGCVLTVTLSMWFFPIAALAQRDDEKVPADQSSWTLAYILVLLAVGLGLMVVCRPGTRQTDIKIRVDDDDDE